MTIPRVKKVYFDEDLMIFEGDGFKTRIDLRKVSRKLLQATETDRAVYTFSPSGYSITWSKLKITLSVSTLLSKYGDAALVEKMMKKKDPS